MRKRTLGITWGISLALLVGIARGESNVPVDAGRPTSDIVCGPRCLRFLLNFFHPDSTPDLMEVVAKVQPEFEKGSSLARLEQYLNSHGLHTLAIEPAAETVIRWPYPVLLYLKIGDDGLGHYVVLLPDSDRSMATIWSGLSGRIRMPTWQLAARMGGAALLVSPDPIEGAPASFPPTMDATLRKGGWLMILIASPIAWFAWAFAFPVLRPWAGSRRPPATVDQPSVPAAIGDTAPHLEIDSDEQGA